MPRVARLIVPDVAVHVVQRGHDRADCFHGEADYRAYLVTLRMYAARFGCKVHAYCLMTNHVHLLLTPSEPASCALLMKHVAQRYSKRLNRRLGRTGTLWEGRYHSGLVATEHYALACYRYIELNPVRAGLVKHPAEYRWSSYAANTRARSDALVTPHPAYLSLATSIDGCGTNYAGLCGMSLGQSVLDDIRRATQGGYAIGTPRRPRGRPPARKMVTVTN
jgi:putative transposase